MLYRWFTNNGQKIQQHFQHAHARHAIDYHPSYRMHRLETLKYGLFSKFFELIVIIRRHIVMIEIGRFEKSRLATPQLVVVRSPLAIDCAEHRWPYVCSIHAILVRRVTQSLGTRNNMHAVCTPTEQKRENMEGLAPSGQTIQPPASLHHLGHRHRHIIHSALQWEWMAVGWPFWIMRAI